MRQAGELSFICICSHSRLDFPGGSDCKVSAYNTGDPGSTPRSGRSSGEGNGNPLQYSCLEIPRKSLVGYSPWGLKESDMPEQLHFLSLPALVSLPPELRLLSDQQWH